MILLLGVHALVVSLQIGSSDKFLVTASHLAWERIFPLVIVCLQVGFVVVAPAEEFATSLNAALVVGLFLGSQPPLRLSRSGRLPLLLMLLLNRLRLGGRLARRAPVCGLVMLALGSRPAGEMRFSNIALIPCA